METPVKNRQKYRKTVRQKYRKSDKKPSKIS